MPRAVIDPVRCKGCLLCTTVCPKNLIRQAETTNQQGYRVAEVVSVADCVGCGFCALICSDMALCVFREKSVSQTQEKKCR